MKWKRGKERFEKWNGNKRENEMKIGRKMVREGEKKERGIGERENGKEMGEDGKMV